MATFRVIWRRSRRALPQPQLDEYTAGSVIGGQTPAPTPLKQHRLRGKRRHLRLPELNVHPLAASAAPPSPAETAFRRKETRRSLQETPPSPPLQLPVILDFPLSVEALRRRETRRSLALLPPNRELETQFSALDFPLLVADFARRKETNRTLRLVPRLDATPLGASTHNFPLFVEAFRRRETRRSFLFLPENDEFPETIAPDVALGFVARSGFKPGTIYFKGEMQAAAYLQSEITAAAYTLSTLGNTVEYHKGEINATAFFQSDFNDKQG